MYRCARIHCAIAQYSGEHCVRYTIKAGCIDHEERWQESRFSFRSSFPDNRNCIHVTQSRRELHKGRAAGYPALSETGHVNEIAQTSTPRTTKHLCDWHIFVSLSVSQRPRYNIVTMTLTYDVCRELFSRKSGTFVWTSEPDLSEAWRNLFSRAFNFRCQWIALIFREHFSRERKPDMIPAVGYRCTCYMYIDITTDVYVDDRIREKEAGAAKKYPSLLPMSYKRAQ